MDILHVRASDINASKEEIDRLLTDIKAASNLISSIDKRVQSVQKLNTSSIIPKSDEIKMSV